MSEQGWRAFLAADGVDDWVILHGGPRRPSGSGRSPMSEDNAVDPLGHGSTFWMQELAQAKPLRHAMHLDVSVARDHAEARISAAVAAAGRIVKDSKAPGTVILADRAGNKVCIAPWPDGAERGGR